MSLLTGILVSILLGVIGSIFVVGLFFVLLLLS